MAEKLLIYRIIVIHVSNWSMLIRIANQLRRF